MVFLIPSARLNPSFLGSNFIATHEDSAIAFLVGSGFNKLLIRDHFILVGTWGNTWLFRQNDILSLMAYIGAFSIIPLGLFIKELAVRFKRTWFIAPLVAYCALCFFQITFIYPDRTAIILLSLAWMWIECDHRKLFRKF